MSETIRYREIAEAALKASPHGWWQKSWRTPVSPKKDAREIGELLCCFADEETPRFWHWDVDGEFVAAFDPPTVVRLLDYIDEADELRERVAALEALLGFSEAEIIHKTAARAIDEAVLSERIAATEARLRKTRHERFAAIISSWAGRAV